MRQRRLNQSHKNTRDRQIDLTEQQRRLVDEESRANAEVAQGESAYAMAYYLFWAVSIYCSFNRLKRLDDDSYRKLQNLAQLDPDCAAVINWLRANKHRFRMEIVEPAAISLTVPNKDYVHAVEACFNTIQLKVRPPIVSEENDRSSDPPQTFVAQCDDDYRLLNRLVTDTTEALGKKARITTWFRPETNITPPPMTAEEVRVHFPPFLKF